MLVEIVTFRLANGVSEDEFLAADAGVQQGVAYQTPGMVRRTTARGRDGGWRVVVRWDAAEPPVDLLAGLSPFVDAASVARSAYDTLD